MRCYTTVEWIEAASVSSDRESRHPAVHTFILSEEEDSQIFLRRRVDDDVRGRDCMLVVLGSFIFPPTFCRWGHCNLHKTPLTSVSSGAARYICYVTVTTYPIFYFP